MPMNYASLQGATQHGQKEVVCLSCRPKFGQHGASALRTPLLRDAMCAAAEVVNLISDDEESDDAPVEEPVEEPDDEPHNVPLSLQRPRRPNSRPDLLMHQSTANGATKPMPAKRAEREQVAARAAGSKSAATSSSARVGSRSVASSSSRASSGNHGEVHGVPQIANMRIKVWWPGDKQWCAACQDSALPRCRPDLKALRTAGTKAEW